MDMKPKNLLKRVLAFAREELERRARNPDDPRHDSAPPHARYAQYEGYMGATAVGESTRDDASEPSLQLLEVLRSPAGGSLRLRWALSPEDVTRAEAMVSGNPVLCLRLVSFSKTRDDVLREVQDRPGIDREGSCEIIEPPQRAVVSLGVRAGERFVSIAHHVL